MAFLIWIKISRQNSRVRPISDGQVTRYPDDGGRQA